VPTKPLRKRQRISTASSVVANTFRQPAADGVAENTISPTAYWVQKENWPKEYFDQDDQTKKGFEKDSWLEKYWETENSMSHLLRRKKSSSSLRRKQSVAGSVPSSTTPSDQKPREIKSAPYQDTRYESILAARGSFMGRSELGVKDTSKIDCRTLLETEQMCPNDSLFCDDLFEEICEMVRNKNEARIVRDISPLIVPSAETLAVRGARRLKILIESANEGWNNSIPVTKTRPQPDYSVGFRREAFTEDQLKRLEPFVGDLTDTSFFMATYYMYFPFLTCEVKCGVAALDVADRQNAHSMTMAVRGIVELFRLVKRETEIHQQILAFSVSHYHTSVRIYGHYPLVDGQRPPSTATRSTSSISRRWMARRSGRHTSSPGTFMIYGCPLTSRESVQSSTNCRPMCILKSPRNPSWGNLDFHRSWRATISLTIQVTMPHLCWKKPEVNRAVFLRGMLPQILRSHKGWVGELPRS
jgi:hypothetical protein